MRDRFTAEEVFGIAMELEETGEVFYEALAISTPNPRVTALCRRLASQERSHYQTFKRMREDLSARPSAPPMKAEDLAFVQAAINDRVIPDPRRAREIARKGALKQALELAIRLEKDTVRFYTQLLPLVPAPDADAVRRIIAEETVHVEDVTAAWRGLH